MKIGSLRNRLTNATNIKRITIIRIIGEKLKYDGTVTRDTSSVNNVNFLKYDKDNKITLKDLQLTSAAKTRLAYPGMYINKIAQVIEKVNEQKNIYTNNKVVDKGGKICLRLFHCCGYQFRIVIHRLAGKWPTAIVIIFHRNVFPFGEYRWSRFLV